VSIPEHFRGHVTNTIWFRKDKSNTKIVELPSFPVKDGPPICHLKHFLLAEKKKNYWIEFVPNMASYKHTRLVGVRRGVSENLLKVAFMKMMTTK